MKHILVTCKGKKFQIARALIGNGEYEIIADAATRIGALQIIDALNCVRRGVAVDSRGNLAA